MLEKYIERHLVKEIKKLGGKAYKFTSPNNRSVPDRLCVLPKIKMFFVECKATDKTPTPLQAQTHRFLRSLGQEVFVVDSIELVDILIKFKKKEMQNE